MEIHYKSLAALEYNEILKKLADCTKTEQAKSFCLNLLPFKNKKDIQKALDYTSESLKILDNALEIPIEFVMDINSLKNKNFIQISSYSFLF